MTDRLEEQIPELLHKGIALFNEQKFFECHEVLEDLWNTQVDPERQFTQGIIQIAVGYHHWLAGNQTGAKRLFVRGLGRIKPFAPLHQKIDVADLAGNVENALNAMAAGNKATVIPQITFRV